jgi:acetaldehyde dehydrogenase (acetylating)
VLIAVLEGVGREYPLSAEKLSPILAFYSAANLAAGIERCQQLLRFGGLGHTVSIHSQNEAAVKQFGLAVPAFRVIVNTSSVHGSIGYSTNLFPAMTLGCGSPGGNITSDNIGPQHLMNIKRVAWESRAIEHRTIPAGQRLLASGSREADASQTPVVAAAAAIVAAATGTAGVPDRQTIARIVEQVFTARGIPRGGAVKSEPVSAAPVVSAASHAAAPSASFAAAATIGPSSPPASPMKSPAPPIRVVEFVSEDDVRSALSRGEKIFLGPKTIITPSARDLASEHEIFVMTHEAPATTQKPRRD